MTRDIYIKLDEKIKGDQLRKTLEENIVKGEKNRIIFDILKAKVTMSGMRELKTVFTEMDTENKKLILEICIIVKGTFTKELISTFIKATRQEIKTRII